MSTERENLTAEQTLMQGAINRIADKYIASQTDVDNLIKDAEKITKAILNFNSDR